MKKVLPWFLASVLLVSILLTFAGCSEKAILPADEIKTYVSERLQYEVEYLKIPEENSEYSINAQLKTDYGAEKFIPFTEKLLEIAESAEKDLGVTIYRVNPAIETSEGKGFGWDSDTELFYTFDEKGMDEKTVSLENLHYEVDKIALETGASDTQTNENGYDIKRELGNKLGDFYGVWKIEGDSRRIIISGDTLNYVDESTFL